MPLRSLFIDFNSYFASVEQQVNPKLRGKPVGVVPTSAETTCCIAASYEANKFGVRTGTIVRDARKLCPGIIFVEGQHNLYVDFHNALKKTIDEIVPVIRAASIDEMACDLTGRFREKETAIALAKKIKKRIAESNGACLRCSIGIAPNQFLAKVATDLEKPDGLVVLDETNLPGRLFTLQLRDIYGIGENMELRLRQHGINSVPDLWDASEKDLFHVWGGVEGKRFHGKLHGQFIPETPTNHSCLSHSHVLPPEIRTDSGAEKVLYRLLQKACTRLRRQGYLTGNLGVKVRYMGKRDAGSWSWYDEMRFLETDDTLELIRVFEKIWARRAPTSVSPYHVEVCFSHLISRDNVTARLLEPREDGLKKTALNAALDKINNDFGKNSVYFGGMFGADKAAPMRIAFQHIPDRND